MKIQRTGFAAALSCAMAFSLAGCGKPEHIDLLGVKLGMTKAEVKAAAPSGADIYCRGDGDDAFDTAAGLPPSTSLKYCTWSNTDSTGQRAAVPVQIGNDTSSRTFLVFDYSGSTLKSFSVEIPNNAYDRVVKSLSDKLGSPDSAPGMLGLGGVHWDAKNDTLTASTDEMQSWKTDLLLVAKPASPN
ncbi:hypothetical protein A9R05_42690 (plasmid) [Burkholderia sp. KK1]|uniref:hypothetical protein n=1 Tax=Burkholderia sp. M701 TaxID=326454 RepID=UPI000979B95D|nr:hypothetical protein [Burkholderia sp. M701]AQH05729.1 hypothetical protein A9R05_42690 [Burkholderia sp. KK1]